MDNEDYEPKILENKLIYAYSEKRRSEIITNTLLCGFSFVCFKTLKDSNYRILSLGVSLFAAGTVIFGGIPYFTFKC